MRPWAHWWLLASLAQAIACRRLLLRERCAEVRFVAASLRWRASAVVVMLVVAGVQSTYSLWSP